MENYTTNNIQVISNMVDLKRFKMGTEYNCDNHEKEKFSLFSCAFLEDGKGMENLIRAFSERWGRWIPRQARSLVVARSLHADGHTHSNHTSAQSRKS